MDSSFRKIMYCGSSAAGMMDYCSKKSCLEDRKAGHNPPMDQGLLPFPLPGSKPGSSAMALAKMRLEALVALSASQVIASSNRGAQD